MAESRPGGWLIDWPATDEDVEVDLPTNGSKAGPNSRRVSVMRLLRAFSTSRSASSPERPRNSKLHGQIFFSLTYGTAPALFSEMFGAKSATQECQSVTKLGQLPVRGAFAPLIATARYAQFGSGDAMALYVAAVAVVSLLSLSLISRTDSMSAEG